MSEQIDNQRFTDINSILDLGRVTLIEDCTFEGIDFSQHPNIFKSVVLRDCTFSVCNLSNVDLLDSSINESKFIESKLIGINWSSVRNLSSLNFQTSDLSFNIFSEKRLIKFSFTTCKLHQCDFFNTNLKNAKLVQCDLLQANFSGANLEGADFRESKNYGIDIKSSKVKGAMFSLPEAASLLEVHDIKIDY